MRYSLIAFVLFAACACSQTGEAATVWSDDFSGETIDPGWQFRQIQPSTSSLSILEDPLDPANRALQALAAPKASQLGKADLHRRFAPVPRGETIEMSGRFYVPSGALNDQILLMDLECTEKAGCNSYLPGIRMDLRKGRLRIERTKIKSSLATWTANAAMPIGRWVTIRWVVKLGTDESGPDAGATQIYMDDVKILDRTGTTMSAKGQGVDIWEVGVTGNASTASWAEVWFDDAMLITP